MTNKELQDILKTFSPDMEICTEQEYGTEDIREVIVDKYKAFPYLVIK